MGNRCDRGTKLLLIALLGALVGGGCADDSGDPAGGTDATPLPPGAAPGGSPAASSGEGDPGESGGEGGSGATETNAVPVPCESDADCLGLKCELFEGGPDAGGRCATSGLPAQDAGLDPLCDGQDDCDLDDEDAGAP